MSRLFNRVVKTLIITDSESREIEGLKTKFDIQKTDDPSANKAKITLYNLAPKTIDLLKKDKAKIAVSGGYTGFFDDSEIVEVIFTGDITRVRVDSSNVDKAINIEAGDGEVAIKDSRVNKSYGPETKIGTIISDVAESMGLPLAQNMGSIDAVFSNGFTASDKSKKVLNNLALKTGLRWSVQNGELFLYETDGNTGEEAIVLGPNTGLISVKPAKSDDKEDEGYTFVALLNPKIRPGRIVVFNSSEVNGQYVVTKVRYKGDSEEGAFIVEGEVK